MKSITQKVIAVVLALAVPSAGLAQQRPIKAPAPVAGLTAALSGASQAGSVPGLSLALPKPGPALEAASQSPGPDAQSPIEPQIQKAFLNKEPIPESALEAQENSSLSDETVRIKAQEGFDGLSRASSAFLHDPGIPSNPVSNTAPEPKQKTGPAPKPKVLIGLIPALGLAASASAQPIGQAAGPQAQNIFQAVAQNPVMEALAQGGYLIGNGLAFVVDIPRMFEAAQSRDPKAVSLSSNLILLAASLLAGARGFLGLDLLWAWQNIVSGVVPMTIALLQFEPTKRLFPESASRLLPNRLLSESPEKYSAATAFLRMGILLLIGTPIALGLGLMGQAVLCPLSSHPATPLARLILQALASAGFVYFLIPQIKKIKETQSIEGVSFWFMRTLLVLCAGLALWAIHGALSEVQNTLDQTLRNLDFWNRLIYSVQGLGSVYVTWLTLKVMPKADPTKGGL